MLISRPVSLRFLIGSQYFLYFGVLGIFLPFFNLYCYHIGFSGFQIGALSALRTGATVLFPLFWGALADRFLMRKPIYILCNFVSTGIWLFFLFTTDFWVMLAITLFYGIFYASIISFLEAFTMDVLDNEKKSYGRIRVWGSISFIMMVMIVGKIIDHYAIEVILGLILWGSLLQAGISIGVPELTVTKKKPFKAGARDLLKMRVVVFLFCAFFMLVSHGTYYGFFSIHLEKLGYSNTFIGITWALASISEIIVMIRSDKIFNRFSFENVLVFSFFIAAVRWFALFFVRSPALILITQVTHAITYGTFHIASILYIDSLTPDEAKTLGQAANNAVSYGLGIMVGFFLNGYLFERVGVSGLFAFSGLVAIAGGTLLLGFQILDRNSLKKRIF